jgi:polyhydroxyalkanoate synthesis regulator phasin
MSENVIIALISGGVGILTSLIGAIGAFHVSMKGSAEKQRADLKAELVKYHEKNREEIKDIRQNDLREIRDDLTNMGANLQQKISLIELSLTHTRQDIETLSSRVEKHNGVIERTYRLEDNDKLLEEKISVANHRIADLEGKVS